MIDTRPEPENTHCRGRIIVLLVSIGQYFKAPMIIIYFYRVINISNLLVSTTLEL